MAVRQEWFNEEHTILLITFLSRWTWEEVWAAHSQGREMVRGLDYKVDTIIDLTYSSPFPPAGWLGQTKRIAEFNHPNTGITVYVRATTMMRGMAKLFWKLFPEAADKYPFEFADTIAEAHAVLTRHREEWA